MKPQRDLARLAVLLAEAADVLAWPEERLYLRVERVSAWSPAQHLDHVFRALDRILGAIHVLETGHDPRILARGGPTFLGRLCLGFGRIPRGRGRAPDEVLPEPRPVRHRLKDTCAGLRAALEGLQPRAAGLARLPGRLPHPILGAFDAGAWARFATVHTRHHLAIVADVDRHRAVGTPAARSLAAEDASCGAGAQAP